MSAHPRSEARFRPDLEGLRGVAILLVLACHVAIPGARAGFIGVDVFFVLSGFLITGLLVDEHERTGRIQLGAFYARRARRILPAAAVVLVTTLLAATIVMSPLDLARIAGDGLAAGLSVANIHFALSATDYFAPTDLSPMLHYWSLSVEEQFYLFWPALLIVAMRLGSPRRAAAILAGSVMVASLVLCIALTSEATAWAYFSLPTRAWQLAAGGILALAGLGLTRLPWPITAATGWAGVGIIVAAVVVIEPMTPYPGVAATAPAAGTLALIAGGSAPGSPGRLLLSGAPIRWLGRISYSLYLWHWPVLIFGTTALAQADMGVWPGVDPLLIRLGLVGVAVVLAALSWRLVEQPFHAGRLSYGGRRWGLVVGSAALLSVTITSSALSYVAAHDLVNATDSQAIVDDIDSRDDLDWPSSAPPPDGTDPPADLPWSSAPLVPSPSGREDPPPAPTPTPAPRPKARLEGRIPRGLTPSLATARDDEDRLLRDGCGLGLAGTEPPDCVYGDRHGASTVALVGDSHALNWFPAFERLAGRRHWRLVPFTKFSCVFVDMRIWSDHLKREYTECEVWRERVVAKLRRLKPDLVVITSNKWFPPMVDRDGEPKRQGAALARLIERIPGTVAILVDTPRSNHDVPACLARHPAAIEACTTPRKAALGWRHRIREVEARRRSGSPLIDLSKAICPTDPCPPIIGKRLVYRDHHHLTATFARSLARDLDTALAKILSP
ncbi:MAG TPA: acyltransferase family protein [Candidatus Limnocylindrales bacterium]|nr:acyltransferase family protein [Candidatus Limnocylindrales bacterium]